MKRIRLMFAYHEFLKGGKYFTAHKILELLNKKKVYLGLDDTSWEVEQLAYKLKLQITYNRNCNGACVYL
mgnify:FL=1